eukprot:SAG11_NODE_13053_length_672_cov_0.966841_1_plen_72_part_10
MDQRLKLVRQRSDEERQRTAHANTERAAVEGQLRELDAELTRTTSEIAAGGGGGGCSGAGAGATASAPREPL